MSFLKSIIKTTARRRADQIIVFPPKTFNIRSAPVKTPVKKKIIAIMYFRAMEKYLLSFLSKA